MDKLKERFKSILDKFKSLGKGIRICIIVAIITFFIAIISMFFYSSSNKYKVLFSNLDPNDAQLVTSKLKEQKVDMKIEGDTIKVPKEQVDELRLEMAPELSSGSKGYELMDNSSSFGMTDDEFKLKKLRIQQGELEKTIKSFPQVENVRVHITPAKDSVFVENKDPGKAAVYLKLVPGNNLKQEQVKSIVALVSGSTENIPKENIEVIDDKMNLLTKDLNDTDVDVANAESVEKQYGLERKYEEELEKSIVNLLEPVIGKNKVRSKVKVDLDFDSKKKTETIIDPNKVIISQETSKENSRDNSGANSESPVDNNMGNTIDDNKNSNISTKEQQKTNYEVGKTENTIISAPGEVKRLTASVFVDGNLPAEVQKAMEDSVSTAIGFNQERGDKISVVGMTFDAVAKADAEKEIEAAKGIFSDSNNKVLTIGGIILALIILLIILIIVLVLRRKKRNADAKAEEEALLDLVIDDDTLEDNEFLKPIDFGTNNANIHKEDEIKRYATEKPDQVLDIVKSWLAESER
ncbi:flagellar basal-body MS-ring/collar protein FliF [Clostridium septicum]|uniref:Flagellar M-ring protein n=1 Tax=Clostridium septicum TaxID=1504 RepID=A0A9N7PJX5_CLOSE|nr:flagellar basal-body MS-ring/collar protein FliF [Clostridium septicum]AYE33432.1 flagellar basal body M-ring protein FliF [Clostridium septicum]QAS61606.1 flagellar basal body M-ring protein FliF [Clostridium septicum]UEC21958.1 flagellar M-ring protein FliF [Clostridium septicum]USS00011.1 flagellar M-ring protein FliF [Clostridium septicum]WLF68536.1 flagellar basal-body MS-ring/collar protein FliF [Clostridium septicum]